jgi:hypothetical protein
MRRPRSRLPQVTQGIEDGAEEPSVPGIPPSADVHPALGKRRSTCPLAPCPAVQAAGQVEHSMGGVRNKRNDAEWIERVRECLKVGFYDS